MNDSSYLVTIYSFKGKDYLVKMNILNRNTLELKITDKITSEDWHCSYDSTYIENLTHKTGNYKQFDIFTTMLKSGLLKTSESITLDLLTFDDLEALRSRRVMGRTFPPHSAHILPASASNRRYLILTYTVEFDRIHYPLPMEYCGLPDPHVLQSTIRRLEQEIVQLQEQLRHSGTQSCDENLVEQINILERRVLELTSENDQLRSEVIRLNNQLNKKQPTQKRAEGLQNALLTLEEQVNKERLSLHQQLRHLKEDKVHLTSQLEEYKLTEKSLRSQLRRALAKVSITSCSNRPSRIDSYHITSPSRSTTDHRNCVTILQDNPLKDGLRKKNGKKSPLPGSKSDFPLTQKIKRNSSASSTEKHHRCPSCSPRRSSSSESLNSVTLRNTGNNSKLKSKVHSVPDYSSSSESTLSTELHKKPKKFSKCPVKKTKSKKDLKKDIRICDLEKRISNLQQILESDLTVNRRNIH